MTRWIPAEEDVQALGTEASARRPQEIDVVKSLYTVAEIADMSLLACPRGHYWVRFACAGYWIDLDYPGNDGMLLRRTYSKIDPMRWQFDCERRLLIRSLCFRRYVKRWKRRGWTVLEEGAVSAEMVKLRRSKGTRVYRLKKTKCYLFLDEHCFLYYWVDGVRFSQAPARAWKTRDNCV